MRRKYLALEQYHCNHSATTITVTITTITVGVTAVSAVTPTVIVALSAHHAIVIVNNLFRRKKKGHERPRLKIISAPKAENKKKMAQICCL